MKIILLILAIIFILISCAPAETFNYYTGEEFRDKAVEEATGEKITGSVIEKIFGKESNDSTKNSQTIYSDESWDNAVLCTYSPPTNPIAGAQWIWEAGWPHECNVSKITDIEGNIDSATIEIAVDNFYILYINGEEIGRKDNDPAWDRVDIYDVKNYFQRGENIVEVKGWNEYNQVGISIKMQIN